MSHNTTHIPEWWRELALGDLIFPVSETYNFKNLSKIHFLNTWDIQDWKLLHNNFSEIQSLPWQAKKKFKKWDILFSEIRPENKRFMLVDFNAENSVASTKLMVLRCKDWVDINFIYKFITSETVIKEFQVIAESRSWTFPQITFEAVAGFPILLPPLPEQRAIANMLSSLDVKIELLREQNETLEKTAQTIFHEWFGRYSVESPEELPEGWRVGKLGEIIEILIDNRGKTPPIIENNDNAIPLVEINAIVGNNRMIDVNQCKKFVDQETYNSWFRKWHPIKGDILISTVGSVGQISQVFDEKISIAQNIVALRFPSYGNFLYELLKSIQNEIISIDISSVQPSIKVPHLLDIAIIIPFRQIIEDFENTILPFTKKISENNSQIKSLSKTRDELLPRLMSGEVRVI